MPPTLCNFLGTKREALHHRVSPISNYMLALHSLIVGFWSDHIGSVQHSSKNTYFRELKFASSCYLSLLKCNLLNSQGANPETILAILRTIKDLYEDGVLTDGDEYEYPRPTPTFPCVAACHLSSFDDFIIYSFMPNPSSELATRSLHELALASQYMEMSQTSVRIIRGLIELGGEAHVPKRSNWSLKLPGHEMRTAQHTTAFESLLVGTFDWGHCRYFDWRHSHYDDLCLLVGVMESLVQTCPDLQRRVILLFGEHGVLLHPQLRRAEGWFALEVDLQFLISLLLTHAELRNIATEFTCRIRELAASFTRPHARARHIVHRQGKDSRTRCYRILHQEPCLDVIDSLRSSGEYRKTLRALEGVLDTMNDPINSSAHPELGFLPECFEEVPIEEEMDMLIQEGIGLYREEDVDFGSCHHLRYADEYGC